MCSKDHSTKYQQGELSATTDQNPLEVEMQNILQQYQVVGNLSNQKKSKSLKTTQFHSQFSLDMHETTKDVELNDSEKIQKPLQDDSSDHKSEESQPLDDFLYGNLLQKFNQLPLQPMQIRNLHPVRKRLAVKLSKRCPICEHNVIKPELNPATCKFKIRLSAIHYIPQISFRSLPPFGLMQPSAVIMCITNPLDFPITIKLKTSNEVEDSPFHKKDTCQVTFPQQSIPVDAYNDLEEYSLDDKHHDTFPPSSSDLNENLDSSELFIVEKSANSTAFYIKVKPLLLGPVMFSCQMEYCLGPLPSSAFDSTTSSQITIWVHTSLGHSFGS
eukprot:Sdes_comp20042_c0_seq1m12855